MTDKERAWLDNANRRGGSFVSTFASACFCADDHNFKLLRPVLAQIMEKYPNYNAEQESSVKPGQCTCSCPTGTAHSVYCPAFEFNAK